MHAHLDPLTFAYSLNFRLLACSSHPLEYLQFRYKRAGDEPGMIFLKGISNEGMRIQKVQTFVYQCFQNIELVSAEKVILHPCQHAEYRVVCLLIAFHEN